MDITANDISDTSWLQASLPVSAGGLGVRRAAELALPAFLASAHAAFPVASEITPFQIDDYVGRASNEWITVSDSPLPELPLGTIQQAWDYPIVQKTFTEISDEQFYEPTSKARLLAVNAKESGARLRALLVAQLGCLVDDESFRIMVGLRIGTNVTATHRCVCRQMADTKGTTL